MFFEANEIGQAFEEGGGFNAEPSCCVKDEGGEDTVLDLAHSFPMREIFQKPESKAVLLVDATNAFNALNRLASLHNISVSCPTLAQILINTYTAPIRMIIPWNYTVLQVLLLQKPSRSSKSSDHATHLKRRLDLWKKGDIEPLSQEGRYIQNRLHKTLGSAGDDEAISRIFCKLMMEGKVQGALRYHSRLTTGGVLKQDDLIPVRTTDGDTCLRSTYDILQEKHPVGKPPAPDCLSNSSPDPSAFNTILFDNLNANTIHQATLHTHGSAGPADLDAHAWRRMCSSFKGASRFHCYRFEAWAIGILCLEEASDFRYKCLAC